MKNAIAWFEIPTTQLDRAQAFYEAVLGQPMRRENMGPSEGAVFAYDPDADGAGGALMMGPTAPQVSGSGTLVYLDASPSLDAALDRARGGIYKFNCRAEVDGETAAEAQIMCTMRRVV